MKRLLIAAVFVVAACRPGEAIPQENATGITVWHDDDRQVTCWVYRYEGGISCLPDSEVAAGISNEPLVSP